MCLAREILGTNDCSIKKFREDTNSLSVAVCLLGDETTTHIRGLTYGDVTNIL
jgi:hypothetical protein